MTSEEFRTDPMFLRNQFKGDGVFEIPKIRKEEIELENVELIGYDKLNEKETDKIVHFFLDDYKFEVMWKDPEPIIERLKNYKAVLSPNYSIYTEMPLSLKVYNTFRSRWCGAFLQSKGIKVIPTVAWGEPNTFWFCFDGIEQGSVVAVSTLGVRKEKALFMQGYNELIRKIKPKAILCYGEPFEEMQGNIIEVDYAEVNNLNKGYFIKKYYIQDKNGNIKGMGSVSSINTPTWKPKKPDDERFLGKPGEVKEILKHTKKGDYLIKTKIGDDGCATKERHYTDHQKPWAHTDPHDHIILWDKESGSPNLQNEAINYFDSVPEFKNNGGDYMCKNTQNEKEHFLSVNDFLNHINSGAEIIIEWEKKTYSISWYNGKISIAQGYKQETEMLCENSTALLNYKLDSNTFLKDVITMVTIVDCTIYV